MTDQRTKTALVLSAGAPHSPLMAGALAAFYERGKTFDIIYTSGAGALIGLLFIAPKTKRPDEALRGLVDLAISDAIYRLLPVNYKVFQKPGPFTRPIQLWANLFKLGRVPLAPIDKPASVLGRWYNAGAEARQKAPQRGRGEIERLYNDLIDMWAAAITPTTLNYKSKGVSDPLPFLEDLVDFDKLRQFHGKFYLNVYSPDTAPHAPQKGRSGTAKGIELFSEDEITPMHVRAAFAYPFIYTPVEINGKRYFEGANRDPINFGNLLHHQKVDANDIKTLVLVDILAGLGPHLLREPRDLWDAFGLSIMVPVVAHAQKELARFEKKVDENEFRFLYRKVNFPIDEATGRRITEWSYSNLSTMFNIGYDAGRKFCDDEGHHLPNRADRVQTRRAEGGKLPNGAANVKPRREEDYKVASGAGGPTEASKTPKVVAKLTRETYARRTYRGRCTEPGCPVEAKTHASISHLHGWFEYHVETTGHSVVIEQID